MTGSDPLVGSGFSLLTACLLQVDEPQLLTASFLSSSSNINKHWEAELAALKGNNAKLTAALLESTANVKQWKQQLAAYQEEAERLHKRVRLSLAAAAAGCIPPSYWSAFNSHGCCSSHR